MTKNSTSNSCEAWENLAFLASVPPRNTVAQVWTPLHARSFTKNCRLQTLGLHLLTWLTRCCLSTTWPTTAPRSRRHGSCRKFARASGSGPWPCRSPMRARMCLVSQPPLSNVTTVLGCSTAERCGSRTVASMRRERQQMSCGSTLARAKTTEGGSRCRPSWWKPACLDTALVRRSTTRRACEHPTRQSSCLTTASFQPKTSWVMLANRCCT